MTEERTMTTEVCTVCRGAYGATAEMFGCHEHTASVREFALSLGRLIAGEESIPIENWAMHLEDALEVMRPDEAAPPVRDLGWHGDYRYFLIKGELWSTPDPTAEGFNPIERRLPASVVSSIEGSR